MRVNIAACLLLLGIAGCAAEEQYRKVTPKDPIVGLWQGKVDGPLPDIPPGPDAEKIAESMKHPTLDLKEDHAFELRVGYPTLGTWKQAGNQIELTASSLSGVPVEGQKMTAILADDQKHLTLSGSQSIEFEKR